MKDSITTLEDNCGHRSYGGICTECAWKKFNADPMNTLSPSAFKPILDRESDKQEAIRRFWEGKRI